MLKETQLLLLVVVAASLAQQTPSNYILTNTLSPAQASQQYYGNGQQYPSNGQQYPVNGQQYPGNGQQYPGTNQQYPYQQNPYQWAWTGTNTPGVGGYWRWGPTGWRWVNPQFSRLPWWSWNNYRTSGSGK